MRGDLERALVGDLEVADLLDVVAPELDPQRVLLGRREDVQDAAADGEVAALLDQLGPRVAGRDQVGDDVGQLAAARRRRAAATGTSSPRPGTCGCSSDADRGDHDRQRPGGRVVGGRVGEPAQHGQPLPDRVGAGREPLVRQGLPARVERDLVGGQQAAQRVDQVLGLAAGAGDGQHRRARAGQRGDGQRLERRRRTERPRCGRARWRQRELSQRRVG